MGASTAAILWYLWLAKTKQAPKGIIHWLPNDQAVADFVKTKVDTLVQDNDELSDNANVSGKMAYNQGLKFLYGTPIYFRGLKSKVGVKAISADAAVYDEFDEAEQSQVAQARKRLSASEVRLERELSTPTIPDFGINKQFQETNQYHYGFKCEHCSEWCILEDYFPDCFQQDVAGKYFHACKKCKGKLNINSGRWIQRIPGNRIRGYQITQLYSPFVTPDEIMHEYHTTEFTGHFYNHVLGIPYLSSSDRITFEMVVSLCDPLRQMSGTWLKPTAMGIDVGSVLHVTVLDPNSKKIIWVGEIKDFEQLDMMFLKFNTRTCVIDALPETRKVRETIARNKSKVWACFYNDNQKGDYSWKEDERTVVVNRTESLDASTLTILRKEISFPQRNNDIERFGIHCQNIAKVVEEDPEKGDRKYVYRKIGPDHFRHSFNYACIAASRMKTSGVMSVFR
jgi:hypothetical protein